ncbi:sulfotransferase family protein [Amylibacter sp. SFDW26]|uniref:sulfotransferase family 2 domain-containing protein n=1 Tax=Amylibacter sp. SFDW26 TaxID=2652722 RepID=UPI0012625B5E|nr:sulfotransferase family 2 domain-containing protein [Amylibacter sp. SFDW26]KAB7615649.1 sulfotransferase family protein [Amylibacter sp. SFDW26]
MLIFIKENLVFFATPKTASTSIETTLGTLCEIRLSKMPSLKHTPYRKYKRLLEPFVQTVMPNEPDCVAAFREPVDWLGSWYRYRSRNELIGKPNSTNNLSFNQFVEGYLQDDQPAYANVGNQAKFISDKNGNVGMTHIFKYDHMNAMVRFLSERLKKQINLPKANVSPKMELSLSPELQRELQNAYRIDFDIYEGVAS